MSVITDFQNLVATHGSPVTIHRDTGWTTCPCLTPEGYRDPEWHLAHPLAPVCNAEGLIPAGGGGDLGVKAFIQPAQSTRLTRLNDEYLQRIFGEIQSDDHVGIFSCDYAGSTLNFRDWSQAGAEWITYNGRNFTVVNANLVPDPETGNPFHHWEVALRLIT
jgi:hypothetical protein